MNRVSLEGLVYFIPFFRKKKNHIFSQNQGKGKPKGGKGKDANSKLNIKQVPSDLQKLNGCNIFALCFPTVKQLTVAVLFPLP